MKRHVHFECIGGASGDMILAALLDADAGLKVEELLEDLRQLPIGDFSLELQDASSRGIRGKQLIVSAESATGNYESCGLDHIRGMVSKATSWPQVVRERILKVFERLAKAEARVHEIPPEQVHFHEVGAVDSIVDICGAVLALYRLQVETISVGAIPLGAGTIFCEHGELPNPAPATMELVKGHPVQFVDEQYEMVTPTAAALLMELMTGHRPMPGMIPVAVGYGVGWSHSFSRPNVLRAILLEAHPVGDDVCVLLETVVDDTPPELIAVALEKALAAGALDAYAVPVLSLIHI